MVAQGAHNPLGRVRTPAPQHNKKEATKPLFLYILILMWYIYILLCSDNSLYTGISDDPQKRFLVHQQGKGSKYTRSHKPLKILYLEKFQTKSEALKRELEIKSWPRAKKIKTLQLQV